MVLGGVFILVAVLWCCRRRQRKKRMQKTELYAIREVRNQGQMSLQWRLIKFLDRVFGHKNEEGKAW